MEANSNAMKQARKEFICAILFLILFWWILINCHYWVVENTLVRAIYFIRHIRFTNDYGDALVYSFEHAMDHKMCQNTNVFMFPNQVNWRTIIIWITWFII